jgi:hypothetical protein
MWYAISDVSIRHLDPPTDRRDRGRKLLGSVAPL